MNYLTEQNPASRQYAAPRSLLENPDAIVIGSGLGGLAIASTLAQRRAMKVLVLEGAPTPGGATHVHEVGGFEFPAGLHSVGDMDPVLNPEAINAWAASYVSGNQLEWAKIPDDHEYAFLGDEGFPWYSSAEETIDHLSRMNLGAGNIRGYFELEEQVQANGLGWALTKLWPRALPLPVREGLFGLLSSTWRKYMGRDTHSVLREELGFSERMAAVFEYMYGNYGQPPDVAPFTLHASMMYHYRKGAYFPKGGAGSVAQAIIPVIESAGGQVAVKSPVEQILIEGNRAVGVRLAGGHEVRSKLIISDASAYTTFTRLVPREVSERHGYLEKVSRTTSSPSHISAMVGWDESISLPRHIVWQMPRCEPAIPHHDVANGDRFYKEQMRFDCMPAYLMSPSSRDPLHATRYPNKTTMMLLVEANPKWLEQATAEPEFRKELESRFIEEALKLMRRRFSQLEGKTPLLAHVQFPMGCNPSAREGGSYGIATTSDRFLRDTHWLRPKTTIENLYLCGQDTFMPGIAGVLIGSRFVYAAITGDWLYLISQEASQYRPRLPAARDEQVGRAPKPR